jgi:hypothetical protein
MPEPDFYRKWAAVHSDEIYLERLDAVVIVEGETDVPFWEAVFAHASKRVRVITGTKDNEYQASGKRECLKYLQHLSNHFFICIDSDYDYIKQAHPEYNARNFVVQTYTYAIENHYLASNTDKGVQDFLRRYSRIIYGAFLAHLAAGGAVSAFCESVAPANARDESLEKLQNSIQATQPSYADSRRYAALGLTADNVYLFIKAKTLKQKLSCGNDLSFDHFPMDKVRSDIAQILT